MKILKQCERCEKEIITKDRDKIVVLICLIIGIIYGIILSRRTEKR